MSAPVRLRILHLITDLGKGGAERFVIALSNELNAHAEVEAVVGLLYPDNAYRESSRGLRIIDMRYRTHSVWHPVAIPEYERLLRDFAPHVVHTHRFLAEFMSSLHVSPRLAYVCHGHDNMEQFRRFSLSMLLSKPRLLAYYEKRLLFRRKYSRVTTHFVANSANTLEFYRRVLPRGMRSAVHLIPYGFDFARFHRADRALGELSRPLRLVNVGSFQEKKNQALAVAAAAELRKTIPSFELNLLGDGLTRPAVEELVRQAGLEEFVRFRGNVDNVEDWLESSDLYLHTATYEPFGLVFLEAMAAGLPIVALDGLGNRDVIRDGVSGILIGEQRPELFVEAILRVIREPNLRQRLVDEGVAIARRYDIRTRAREFVDFYRRILP